MGYVKNCCFGRFCFIGPIISHVTIVYGIYSVYELIILTLSLKLELGLTLALYIIFALILFCALLLPLLFC